MSDRATDREMTTRHIPQRRTCVLATAILSLSCAIAEAQEPTMNPLKLGPGVIIDPSQSRGYVMAADGAIVAINLVDGRPAWTSRAGAKPLGIVGGRLIAQVEQQGAPQLRTVALDLATGAALVAGAQELPPGVGASVTETPRGVFAAAAQPAGEEAEVSWEFNERPKRGVPPGTEAKLQPPPGGAAAAAATPAAPSNRGAFRMNLVTGATAPAPVGAASPARALMAPPERRAARIPNVSGRQTGSLDGRHILVSRLTGDAATWDRYTLTIYAAGAQQPLGEFKSHLSVIPFFVSGARAVYLTSPFTRRTEQGLTSEPLKLRAVDLQTGREAWSVEVRDPHYRGPQPP